MSLYGGREHLGEEDSEQQPRRSQRQRTLTEKGQAFRADLLVGKVEDLRVQLLSLIEDAEEGLRLPVIDTPAMINRHKEITNLRSEMDEAIMEWEALSPEEDNEDIRQAYDRIQAVKFAATSVTNKIVAATSKSRSGRSYVSSRRSERSHISTSSSKRREEAAEAAALQERLEQVRRENEQKDYIEKEEQRLAAMKRRMDEERILSDIRAQEAKLRMYDDFNDSCAISTSSRLDAPKNQVTIKREKQFSPPPSHQAPVKSLQEFQVKKEGQITCLNPFSPEFEAEMQGNASPSRQQRQVVEDVRSYRPPPPYNHDEGRGKRQHRDFNSSRASDDQTTQPTSIIVDAIAAAVSATRLPVPEPPIFDGDALSYAAWRSSFDTLIGCKGISDTERIHFLKRYVSGQAKEAINGYFITRGRNAYHDALKVLDSRFGNPFVVADAFRSKLELWPRIAPRDNVGLQRLSDFLLQCEAAARETQELQFLNDMREISKISQKLPEWISHRWNRTVATSKSSKHRYPNFKEFTDFVKLESDIVNDPVISSLRSTTQRENPVQSFKGPIKTKRQVLHSGTEEQESESERCHFCKRTNHDISVCRSFMREDYSTKKDFIMKEKLCFGCLRQGHQTAKCPERKTCTKCSGRHPTCLHDRPKRQNEPQQNREAGDEEPPKSVPNQVKTPPQADKVEPNAVSHKISGKVTGLTSMIVPVYLSSANKPEKEVLVYALLDTMSDATFVSKDVAGNLETSHDQTTLKITTMTDNSVSIKCNRYSELLVRGFRDKERIKLPPCYDRNDIPMDKSHIPCPNTAAHWPHLKKLEDVIPPVQNCPIGLLIGYNCPQALAPVNCVIGGEGEPYAVETRLGWSIVGGGERHSEGFDSIGSSHRIVAQIGPQVREVSSTSPALIYKTQTKDVTTAEFLQLMERDFTEPSPTTERMSQEDLRFLKLMEDEARQDDKGYYEMPLPFKQGEPSMPRNRQAAMQRVTSLRHQFQKRPLYFQHYATFMQEIIERGDAELVPEDEIEAENSWYIPHHGVYHPHKPNKVRVVFDCSARHQGVCLNEHLMQGPDLINSLTGVLCRFREGPVAFTCDVEKMYHQFRVAPRHRNFLRFLWWNNNDLSKAPRDYRMKVHLFGAASSPGCANFGLKKLASDYRHVDAPAAEFLKRDFYVDDGLKSASSAKTAVNVLRNAREICKQGNLRLHKVISNSTEVSESVPESERGKAATTNVSISENDKSAIERTLGLQWDISNDSFTFELCTKESKTTRRGILSTVASIYDPLGLIAPAVLPGRLILQQMCKDQLGWDERLPVHLEPDWKKWTAELEQLQEVKVPRCFQPSDFGTAVTTELHHFSDASTLGYGQCSYLRLINEQGEVHCSLVMAKARVAPLKAVTIPRLELQAAVLSSIVANFLRSQLTYENVTHHFWTDSKVVLGYIQNDSSRFHVYVANRVEKIRQNSQPNHWHYVSTENNPADHASRGLTVKELSSSNWFAGPSFLWEHNLVPPEETFELSHEDREVKRTVLSTVTETTPPSTFEQRIKRFNSMSRLIGAMGVLVKRCTRGTESENSRLHIRQKTETRLIRLIQKEHYGQADLKSPASPLRALDPFIDSDGLLRVGGRIRKSAEEFNVKHPIILPKNSHLSLLIALRAHNEIAHQGRNMTLNHIRSSGFWIVGGRRLVTSCIKSCFTCRKHRGPTSSQKMGELPEDRVDPSPPFTYCGLDCFGPFAVKDGRRETKRYGLLVTCLASRAIHIEVLDDLSTDAFLNGLRCVIALRGKIRLIRCDQGTNFVGARNELQEEYCKLDPENIARKLSEMDCEFQMNVPSASHMGGVWERQIRTVRSVLTGLLGRETSTRLDSTSLRVVMYEVMAIVNSRPLTVDQLGDFDGPLPLTPNHILTMKSGVVAPPPPGVFTREDLYLSKRWRKVQFIADQFWSRWKREYLQSIQVRSCWRNPKEDVHKGDIVLLKDDSVCRADWKVGRVVETFPGEDGLVRKVRLLMGTSLLDKRGKPLQQRSYLDRPVHRLVVLLPHQASSH